MARDAKWEISLMRSHSLSTISAISTILAISANSAVHFAPRFPAFLASWRFISIGALRSRLRGSRNSRVCQESIRTSWMSSNATRGEKIETDMTELTAVDLPLCRIRATVFDQRQVHLRGNSHLRRELPGLLSPARVSWEVETAWRPSHRTRHWQ